MSGVGADVTLAPPLTLAAAKAGVFEAVSPTRWFLRRGSETAARRRVDRVVSAARGFRRRVPLDVGPNAAGGGQPSCVAPHGLGHFRCSGRRHRGCSATQGGSAGHVGREHADQEQHHGHKGQPRESRTCHSRCPFHRRTNSSPPNTYGLLPLRKIRTLPVRGTVDRCDFQRNRQIL